MADKKMNELGTASDAAYIYAETSSGEQIRISKADLASVVAGLLGIKSMRVTKQVPMLVGDSYYLDTGLPKRNTIPFAYRDYSRIGWSDLMTFIERNDIATWRIRFSEVPSGNFEGILFYMEI